MGELYNPYPKLPKNIRQIGERDEVVRLYLEDYVNTYLKRLYPQGGQDLRVGLLLGSSEVQDGTPYIFIDGAMEMEGVTEEGEKVAFTEAAWKRAYQSMEETFQTDRPGVVPVRRAGQPVKPLKLLEAAYPVFFRKKPAHVPELRHGGRGGHLHDLGGRILPAEGAQYLL